MPKHLSPVERDRIVCRLPTDVRDLLQEQGGSLFLAGGFLRAVLAEEEINDIDLFAASPDAALTIATRLGEGRDVLTTGNAYTVRRSDGPAVQVVHRWTFSTPEEVLESFDFTVAQAILFYDPAVRSWKTLCHAKFTEHLREKTLAYTAPKNEANAGGSLLRVIRFARRGYNIPLESLATIVARIGQAAHQNADGSSEDALAAAVTALLYEVDPAAPPETIRTSATTTAPHLNLRLDECLPF